MNSKLKIKEMNISFFLYFQSIFFFLLNFQWAHIWSKCRPTDIHDAQRSHFMKENLKTIGMFT